MYPYQEKVLEVLEDIKTKFVHKGGQTNAGPQLAASVPVKSLGDQIADALKEQKSKVEGLKKEGKGFALSLDAKAVGNMGTSASLTGSYFSSSTLPGVAGIPYEIEHVRDLLRSYQVNTSVVRYVVDKDGEGGPTMVAEASAKPQIDRDFEIKDAPVRKMATHFRVPDEMLEDIGFLGQYLSEVGSQEIADLEDQQILYGDGTGQNFSGFNTTGTAFAAGTSVVSSPTRIDVISAAKKQLRTAKYGGPLYALVNPADAFRMRTTKDTTGNYIFSPANPMPPKIDGVTVIEHTAVTDDGFFVFSPRAAALADRAGLSVRFFDQDQDNATKNLITVVIERRTALVTQQPGAIIRGTFTTAITELTS